MSDTKSGMTSYISSEEDQQSPDMFSDDNIEASNSSEAGLNESEPPLDVPEWKGLSLDEIHKGLGKFDYEQVAPIVASSRHTVLFAIPVTGRVPPKPYPDQQKDKWSPGYVRMPHSTHSLYPNNHTNGNNGFRQRWEVIQEALLRNFVSSHQLEVAILSYNQKYAQRWDFSALHHFFSDVVEEEVAALFCDGLLPKIIQLALQLPVLVTGPIPLLKRHTNVALSLSQLQVGSLLANAFLCTFPRRNSTNPQSEYAMYPEINFNRLFGAFEEGRLDRSEAVMEKLKCIFHYFRRITSKAPEGVITIQRRYIPKENCPRWNRQDVRLPPLHITSNGTIETEGAGLLQVDFANKYIGGGVLGWGCVQEEIRFVICPELMVSMLVAEALDDTEAVIVTGVERYSNYEGYSDTFKWTGDFVDETPRDSSGRRRTSIVAIDALLFKQSHTQFTTTNIIRELNKAYVGFGSSEIPRGSLSAIATGNWGCGAFKGNPELKVLLQLMAAAVAGRSMVYFTFGDTDLRDKVAAMYWHLIERNVDVGQLFILLCENQTCASNSEHSYLDFYHSLYKRSKMKPLTNYFSKISNKTTTGVVATHKNGSNKISDKLNVTVDNHKMVTCFTSSAKMKEDTKEEEIRKWIDDDSIEAEFNTDFNLDTVSENSSVKPIIPITKDELDTANAKIKDEQVDRRIERPVVPNIDETSSCVNSSRSQSQLSSTPIVRPRELSDVERKTFEQDLLDDQEMNRAKKPRLSDLDSMERNNTSEPSEKQTLEELTLLVNNINDQKVKVTQKKQKKISDFFT